MNRHERSDLETFDKGVPPLPGPLPLGQVAARGWNVLREDLPLPAAVLKRDALLHNRRWMREFLRSTGAQLAPHGKTTLSPSLFDMQVEDGAWGITVATPHQIQVARHFGCRRLFLANQLVGHCALNYVARELQDDPAFEFYCLVDSEQGVEQLAMAVSRVGTARPINVLIEMGYRGGRTGCRSIAQAQALAEHLQRYRGRVALCGVEGFEGLLIGGESVEAAQNVERFLEEVARLAVWCDERKLFSSESVLLSAGGSSFFDLVAKRFAAVRLSRPTTVLLRSGCYLTHDHGLYARMNGWMHARSPEVAALGSPQPALEVWAYVQSRPEESLAIVQFGKRDVSYDDLPVPLYWCRPEANGGAVRELTPGHKVLRLNDQHCYLEVPTQSPLQMGDMLGFGISHPCLTFDKWRVLHIVDASYDVVGSLRTYF